MFDGTLKPGDTVKMMATGAQFTLVEVGHMGATSLSPCDKLCAGEVGYLTASIKTVRDTRVGDTVTLASAPCAEALPGYRKVTPMVFCGIYTVDGAKYPDLKDALEKLQLNDASLSLSRRPARRWDSASGAAFWACCIWISLPSVWNGNLIWI